jgi:hypothetical protein
MIYTCFREDFLKALSDFVKVSIPDPGSHKNTALFTLGEPKTGHYLRVDCHGWSHDLHGVNVEKRMHIASPLANLQAAAVFFGL